MSRNKNKDKNKNRFKKINNAFDPHNPPVPGTSYPAFSVATSSTIEFIGDASCPNLRTFDGTVELSIGSEPTSVEQVKQLRSSDKRDSVISSNWKGPNDELHRSPKATSQHSWRWKSRRWWPCRAYRWISEFVLASGRAHRGPGWRDWVLTLCLASTVIFCSYIALELFLSMLKFATAEEADCSIVYVTVPGPIITVSLINPSPSNPSRGTYFFSVVNGTTEWMNGVAPPNHFNTLITKTPDFTPVISALPTSPTSSMTSIWLTEASTPGVSLPSRTPSSSTMTLTRATITTIGGLRPGTSSTTAQLVTSRISMTLTRILSGGVTSMLTSVSTTIFGGSPPGALPSLIQSTTLSSLATLTSSILITLTSTSTTAISLSPLGTIVAPTLPSTLNVVTTPIGTLSGGPTTLPIVSTTTFGATTLSTTPPSRSMLFSSSSLVYSDRPSFSHSEGFSISLPKPAIGSTSSVITVVSSSISSIVTQVTSGLTKTVTLISTTPVSVDASSFASSSPFSSIGASSYFTVTQVSSSLLPGSSIFSWHSPSRPPGLESSSSAAPSGAISSSSTRSLSGSRMFSTSSGTVSTSTKTTSSLSPSLSMTSLASSNAPGLNLSSYTSSHRPSISSTFTLPSLSTTSSYPYPSPGSTTLLPSGVSSTTDTPSPSSPSGALNQTTSTLIFTSLLSFRISSRTVSNAHPTSEASTLGPPMNASSSSSRLTSSSLSSTLSSTLSSSASQESSSSIISSSPTSSSATSLDSSSWSMSRSSIFGSMSIQTDTRTERSFVTSASGGQEPTTPSSAIVPDVTITSTPLGGNGTSLTKAQGLMTKIVSFGDTAWSFVFPTPSITTTISYWTGVYPTLTGPMPSDLQILPPTTRSVRQTPLSVAPSFELFSLRARNFKTVVTTIYDDGGAAGRNLKRAADAPVAPTLATTTVRDLTPTSAEMSDTEAPGPTSCGESGNFTLNFDDTVVGPNEDQILAVNGLANPYHHLFYANGYTYVPDKWEPYPAISQPNIAMFLPLTGRLLPNQPFTGTLLPGELGAGPRASVSAYWFNAYSGYFGCALSGISSCVLRISGYRYDAVLQEEVLVVEQNATLAACWGYMDCRLTQVLFSDEFQALSGIQFNAYTAGLGIPQVHMVDDLRMAWYNNSCSAGIQRIGHR